MCTTTIVGIDTFDGEVALAHAPQSVTVRLADDIDVGRGDLIVHPRQEPRVVREFDATICQLSDRPLRAGDRVTIKHTTQGLEGHRRQRELPSRYRDTCARKLPIHWASTRSAACTLRVAGPLAVDDYADDRLTGSFLLIDEHDGQTLAAGLVGDAIRT